MGGLDVIETGDFKQAAPISDESLFTEGAYRGKSVGDTNDCMTPARLTQVGLALREEFRDVVTLRNVHRRDDGDDSMPPGVREAYRHEADRFQEVVLGLANCTWSPRDRAWLN